MKTSLKNILFLFQVFSNSVLALCFFEAVPFKNVLIFIGKCLSLVLFTRHHDSHTSLLLLLILSGATYKFRGVVTHTSKHR